MLHYFVGDGGIQKKKVEKYWPVTLHFGKLFYKVLACNITFWQALLQSTLTIISNFVVHYGDLCACTWM